MRDIVFPTSTHGTEEKKKYPGLVDHRGALECKREPEGAIQVRIAGVQEDSPEEQAHVHL